MQRRTYEEITALLVSAQLHAAWICGYPYVAYRDQLSLIGVPVWRGKTLYQSYIIVAEGRTVATIDELKVTFTPFLARIVIRAFLLPALSSRRGDFDLINSFVRYSLLTDIATS